MKISHLFKQIGGDCCDSLHIKDVELRQFKINDLFEVKRGQTLNMKDIKDGPYPYISASSNNNGIVSYCDKFNSEGNVITVACDGTHTGASFYQDSEFFASANASVLKLKNKELNKFIALFVCSIIRFETRERFNYGRKLSSTRLKELIIQLPVTDDLEPDWEFMENYMKQVANNTKKLKLNKNIIDLRVKEWKEFNLIDYFDMFAGKYYPKSSFSNGETPLVTAKGTDNGISSYTNLAPKFPSNCLTIGKVDASTFYQKEAFCASSDVTILIPKEDSNMNVFIGLFLSSIISKERNKWNYGRQIRLNNCKKLKIKLPVTIDLEPDWEFMENYMKEFITE